MKKINNLAQLIQLERYVKEKFSNLKWECPSQTIFHKITFKNNGFILNIFKNGTINYQGIPNIELELKLSGIIDEINKNNP